MLTLVRVHFECQLAVSLLQLICRGVFADAQQLIVLCVVALLGALRRHIKTRHATPEREPSTEHSVLLSKG